MKGPRPQQRQLSVRLPACARVLVIRPGQRGASRLTDPGRADRRALLREAVRRILTRQNLNRRGWKASGCGLCEFHRGGPAASRGREVLKAITQMCRERGGREVLAEGDHAKVL